MSFTMVRPEDARALGTKNATVLSHLAFKADEHGTARVSVPQISAATGIPRRTVDRCLARLRTLGVLTTERSRMGVHTLTPQWRGSDPESRHSGATESRHSRHSGVTSRATLARSTVLIEELQEHTSAPERGGTVSGAQASLPILSSVPSPKVTDDGFTEWYAAYPRHKGKADAAKAYRAARRLASAEDLLAAAEKFAAHCREHDTDAQYIAYPATWLRKQRWLDVDDPEDDRWGPVFTLTDQLRQIANAQVPR